MRRCCRISLHAYRMPQYIQACCCDIAVFPSWLQAHQVQSLASWQAPMLGFLCHTATTVTASGTHALVAEPRRCGGSRRCSTLLLPAMGLHAPCSWLHVLCLVVHKAYTLQISATNRQHPRGMKRNFVCCCDDATATAVTCVWLRASIWLY